MPASIARRLGSHVLTETMKRRPDLGLDSYDRLFPNQDTLPRGGFGNLIALPLQKRPRDCGNSVFVDEDFTPFDDQWALLSSIQRMSLVGIEELVNRASKNGRVIGLKAPVMDDEGQPWSMAPSRKTVDLIPAKELPTNLELTLGDQVYIPKADLPPALRNCLIRLAAFQNPEFYKAQSMRLPTWGKPRIISCADDYAATVRRLVRDGVDAPLAKMFVHVAREFDADAQGTARARSTSEAFLFRRLESLPETEGRFTLNQELPIPFDGWGNMEVDLIDTEARLVIELDGGQHFSNRDAYRRDRRKDALLQEHGYFVLRFLVEDVGKRLDQVLDAILRVIDQRSRFGK